GGATGSVRPGSSRPRARRQGPRCRSGVGEGASAGSRRLRRYATRVRSTCRRSGRVQAGWRPPRRRRRRTGRLVAPGLRLASRGAAGGWAL
ncbi:MAG: hypothetical protein AVDCRST_MAG19-109, partial [uncultured Thermomicrobiales bacterium]